MLTRSHFDSHAARTIAKKALKKPFHLFGLEVVRLGSLGPDPSSPPEVKDHPIDALYTEERLHMVHRGPAFLCDLEWCTTRHGFRFGPTDWDPCVAALIEYVAQDSESYETSFLKKYYSAFQPKNASHIILDDSLSPSVLSQFSPWAFVPPWENQSPTESEASLRGHIYKDNKRAGRTNIELEEGHHYFGPVSTEKGRLEFNRLTSVYESIAQIGYKRQGNWDGDIGGVLLRRGDEYRVLVDHGGHRLAAVAALGYESIPVRIVRPTIIEARDVDHWPQVESGVYTREEALTYFHYLFDFNSLDWAKKRGLAE